MRESCKPVLVNRWIYSTESWVRKVNCKLNPILPPVIPTLGLANVLHKGPDNISFGLWATLHVLSYHVEATGRLGYILFAKVYFGLNWAPLTYSVILTGFVCACVCASACTCVYAYMCLCWRLEVDVRCLVQILCFFEIVFDRSHWWLHWLARDPQDLPISAPPTQGLSWACTTAPILCGCWGWAQVLTIVPLAFYRQPSPSPMI